MSALGILFSIESHAVAESLIWGSGMKKITN
jgi:hypothetical protein